MPSLTPLCSHTTPIPSYTLNTYSHPYPPPPTPPPTHTPHTSHTHTHIHTLLGSCIFLLLSSFLPIIPVPSCLATPDNTPELLISLPPKCSHMLSHTNIIIGNVLDVLVLCWMNVREVMFRTNIAGTAVIVSLG